MGLVAASAEKRYASNGTLERFTFADDTEKLTRVCFSLLHSAEDKCWRLQFENCSESLSQTDLDRLVYQAKKAGEDEREVTTSLAYLRDSETVAEGLRDLVWALVNTKEFMINH